jgi:hypothetical protein
MSREYAWRCITSWILFRAAEPRSRQTPFGSSNPSLSRRVGVKHFQTAPAIAGFDVTRRVTRFSSGSALWPSHDWIRRMRRTNLSRRACRKTCGRSRIRNGLTSSIVPAGTSLPPIGGTQVSSSRVLLRPMRCEMVNVTSVHRRHGRSCLLGRAEQSSPKAALRRAIGAGRDGERADRAIIRAVAMHTI